MVYLKRNKETSIKSERKKKENDVGEVRIERAEKLVQEQKQTNN